MPRSDVSGGVHHHGHRELTALEEGPFTRLNGAPLTVTLDVPFERLDPGPTGSRFATVVRDTDDTPTPAARRRARDPWSYDDLACPSDLEELLGDRRFLAQHAYAVAASTLDTFETTLGRRLPWRSRGHQLALRLFEPIEFDETGYDGRRGDIRFGHSRDGRARRHVPLALYRDLVAHEVTHAIVDGYRPHFADPDASLDEHALHEGFADAVAMLSVFSSTSRVDRQINASTSDPSGAALQDEALLTSGLFGVADGLYSRQALRRSIGVDTDGWRTEREPHRRGEVLVRALMESVLAVWRSRMNQPGGRSSGYQVAEAGARSGQQVLRMLVRGLGYTPPVDATFEDLLRGVLAADMAVIPDDEWNYRGVLRKAFARLGIAVSADDGLNGLDGLTDLRYPIRLSSLGSDPEEVYRFLWGNPTLLRAVKIDSDAPLVVERVRQTVRVGSDGFVVSEIGASFVQMVPLTQREARNRLGLRVSGPVVLRGGGAVRFDEGGRLSFAALKPVMDAQRQQARLDESAGATTVDQSPSEIDERRGAVFAHLHSADQ